MKLSHVIIYLMQTWEGMFLKNPSRKTIKVLNTEVFLSGVLLRTIPGITAVNQLLLLKNQINTFGTKESHDSIKKLVQKIHSLHSLGHLHSVYTVAMQNAW